MTSKDFRHFRTEQDQEGILTVWIDVADRSMNVFSDDVLRELQDVVTELEKCTCRAVVFRSAKPSGFFAGADVLQIAQIKSSAQAEDVLLKGQNLFKRIEELPASTVAVIHGPCLGGGLEFALACDFRFAVDSSSTRMGLPETQLGLIPGWGGTQRLPRLIGLSEALTMILTGKKLSAANALRKGLIDQLSASESLSENLQRFLNEITKHPEQVRARRPRSLQRRLTDGVMRWLVIRLAEARVAGQAKHYPALPAAIRAVSAAFDSSVDGYAVERAEFIKVLQSDTCRHLLNIFCWREQARNQRVETMSADTTSAANGNSDESSTTTRVECLGVIGAGAMGAGIAQLAALKGLQVIIKEQTPELADAGMQRIRNLLDTMVKKKRLSTQDRDAAMERVRIASADTDLAECDVVIEAVVERMDVKKNVFSDMDKVVRPDCILATNTSALSVSEMAAATQHPERVAGLHFFNPVHRMELVEVVRTDHAADATIDRLLKLAKKLGKTPIITKDSHGFLVNRVLFPYIGEAVRMLLEGFAPEELDREAKRFGMPMGPIELLDHVGLDVALHVAETLRSIHPDSDVLIGLLQQMVDKGWLGRKSERGFYSWKSGRRRPNSELPQLLDAAGTSAATTVDAADAPSPQSGQFAPDGLTDIQRRLIYPMVNEAAACLDEGVVREPWMVDLAMVLGTGFAPFRGGPISFAESVERAALLNNFHVLAARHGRRFRPAAWLVSRPENSGAITS